MFRNGNRWTELEESNGCVAVTLSILINFKILSLKIRIINSIYFVFKCTKHYGKSFVITVPVLITHF